MRSSVQKIDAFHETPRGKAVFGLIELLGAYGFASLAIDSGALWQYVTTAVLLAGGLRNLVNAARTFGHDEARSN